jgi:hypothetical protein
MCVLSEVDRFSMTMFVCRIFRPYSKLLKREQSSSSHEYRDRSLYKYFLDIQTR